MGSVGYGSSPGDQPTTAPRTQSRAGAATMLAPMDPDDGGFGYDERPNRRRQKKNKAASEAVWRRFAACPRHSPSATNL